MAQTLNGHSKANGANEEDITADMQDMEGEPAELTLEFLDEIHQSNTLVSLNMMRKNRHFCDVILHIGDIDVHAHRAVLASASPYLFELFSTDQDHKRHENIVTYTLNGGFVQDALSILIDYAYTARLNCKYSQVKNVFMAANHLKMERVTKICAQHLIKNMAIENCIEIRGLPGIARNKDFVLQVDGFISKEFDKVSKNKNLLNLDCARIEVLNQSREEMSLVNPNSLCRLVLEWIKRQVTDESLSMDQLFGKTFMLYLAVDNSLQDALILPSGDISDTEIVQDYKKMSLKTTQSNTKPKRKPIQQPTKPRVLIYNREIGEELEYEVEPDWSFIGSNIVGENNFLALVTLSGKLCILSIQLRLNTPTTPSPVQTPDASKHISLEKPDLYCDITNMSCQRCAVGCGNYKNTLLVCGGYDRTECLRSVEQYIPETNTWKKLPQMRESRGRFKIAVLADEVYAIGGSNGTTELDSVEKLDKKAEKWSNAPKLHLARSNMGVATLNDLIYCIGGWNGQVGIKQCEVFDPKTSTWSSIAPLNTGRYQAGVTAYKNLVYAIGGCDSWNCLNSVEVYDPEKDLWSMSKPINTARRGCGTAVFNNKIYVIGGTDGSHSLNSTEVFDDETQNWVIGPSMTIPRANVEVAVVGDRLYAVGGFSGKNFLNTIEYLDAKSNEWTTFVPGTNIDILHKRRPRSRKNSRKSISEDKTNKTSCGGTLSSPSSNISEVCKRDDNGTTQESTS